MEHLPFQIKVNAVIIIANGDQEDLGTIGSTALKDDDGNSTVIKN